MQKRFQRLLSYVFYPQFFFHFSDGYIYERHGRIYLASFSRAGICARRVVKLAQRCFSPWNSALLPFLCPSHLCSRIPSYGHANSTVNWIVSCTSSLSLIRCGARVRATNKSLTCLIHTIIRIAYFERILWIATVKMDITNKKMWTKYRIYKFLDRICSIWHFAQSQCNFS